MIYCCDHCCFVFSRAGAVEVCPNCDKSAVRIATKKEELEYNKNRAERDNQK